MYPRWHAPPPPQSGAQASSTWYPLAVADATLAKTGLSLSSSYGTHVGRRTGTLVDCLELRCCVPISADEVKRGGRCGGACRLLYCVAQDPLIGRAYPLRAASCRRRKKQDERDGRVFHREEMYTQFVEKSALSGAEAEGLPSDPCLFSPSPCLVSQPVETESNQVAQNSRTRDLHRIGPRVHDIHKRKD